MFDGGTVHATWALKESGNLVSCIGYVALDALLEEVYLLKNGVVEEPMVEGRL